MLPKAIRRHLIAVGEVTGALYATSQDAGGESDLS
jgi:hypothetical protein